MTDSYASPLATYAVQYVGSIPVTVSIKSLDFQKRTRITRECILRVCEDVGLRVPSTAPKIDGDLSGYIGNASDLAWTRQSVRLSIAVDGVTVQNFHSNQVLFEHPLASVSFASSGEAEMMDFVSYIAKDDVGRRMCYVFYCSGGCSREFIACIGEAFKRGYRGFKKIKKPQNFTPARPVIDDFEPPMDFAPAAPVVHQQQQGDLWGPSSHSYQNQPHLSDPSDDGAWLLQDEPPLPAPSWGNPQQQQQQQWVAFGDQQPPTPQPEPPAEAAVEESSPATLEPLGEPWYVGHVSRQKAESLLQYDGDFLVRASTQQPDQYVLSGVQNGRKRHLLLINPDGQVRTKDRIFGSIQELVDYHLRSTTPIRSADSELKLVFPVSSALLDQ